MELARLKGNWGAFSPNGERVVTIDRFDGTMRVWDVNTFAELACSSGGDVASLDWSRDGRRIVSSSRSSDVRVWDITTGQEIVCQHERKSERETKVAFSPDGLQIAGLSEDKHIWDATTGQETTRYNEAGGNFPLDVVFSADGQLIWTCTASVRDKNSRISFFWANKSSAVSGSAQAANSGLRNFFADAKAIPLQIASSTWITDRPPSLNYMARSSLGAQDYFFPLGHLIAVWPRSLELRAMDVQGQKWFGSFSRFVDLITLEGDLARARCHRRQ